MEGDVKSSRCGEARRWVGPAFGRRCHCHAMRLTGRRREQSAEREAKIDVLWYYIDVDMLGWSSVQSQSNHSEGGQAS